MKTQVVLPDQIEQAISFLKEGIPVAFPTETVYGLGASIFLPEAIKQVFAIKGRPSDNPLIVHVSSVDEAIALSQHLPPSFFRLVDRFWPGPLTLVVQKNSSVPDSVSGGLSSIAIRMPSHIIAKQLIKAVGPLAAPSANISGRPSPTSANDVLEDLEGKIPLILDGGDCSIGIESTVLSLLGDLPVLLRPGLLTREVLEDALGCTIDDPKSNSPILSPGMKYRHYAPKAKVRLRFHPDELKGSYVLSPTPSSDMRLLNEKTLYAELRRADRCGVSEIDIDCSPVLLNNKALMNRLLRSAEVENINRF
jgi:L-threonylcarbamoyladenylate synthase